MDVNQTWIRMQDLADLMLHDDQSDEMECVEYGMELAQLTEKLREYVKAGHLPREMVPF